MIKINQLVVFFSKIKLQQSLARPDKDKYVICDKINTSCNSIKAGPGIANINASNYYSSQTSVDKGFFSARFTDRWF